MRSLDGFAKQLEEYDIEAYSAGDERQFSNILNAVANGYEIGSRI